MKRSHRVNDAVKRLGDVVASALLLVILSPLLLVVTLLVRSRLGTPAIFKQQRPGKDGRLFTIYKFRSMKDAPEALDAVAAVGTDSERLTPFGRKLRSTSIDELPELLNVLRGDMSLVGPRPLLVEYLGRYSAHQARRHEVRPGITGWAQVNGRNAVSWAERLDMDVWYVDHRSIALDVRILFMTVLAVFKREGVSSATHATMEPFQPDQGDRHDREDS